MQILLQKLLHLLWCQPQTLLGALFWLLVRGRYPGAVTSRYLETLAVEIPGVRWGLSLGLFLFCGTLNRTRWQVEDLKQHEWGHARQSLLLGPLYLLVIGLPSVSWALAKTFGWFPEKEYEWFYTEAWAENLKERATFRSGH